MVLQTFTPRRSAQVRTQAARINIQKTAISWQFMAVYGSSMEIASTVHRRSLGLPLYPNAINELCGLMGSVGEQLGLARTAEQDVQRWQNKESTNNELQRRMAVRALSEVCMLFTLGAAHGCANAVLRAAYLDEGIRSLLKLAKGAYSPASTKQEDWKSFSPRVNIWDRLRDAAEARNSQPAIRMVKRLLRLRSDSRFTELDQRRSMDFHRHRPPSLLTASPRKGASEFDPEKNITTLTAYTSHFDEDSDARAVHRIGRNGLITTASALRELQPLIIATARAANYRIRTASRP